MNQARAFNSAGDQAEDSRPDSVLSYFRENQFNPVLIGVEDPSVWESHFRKRQNLYEGHLKIPLALLSGRSVLEFGCNSGENALVLASVGADLTLVEPNEQVQLRLKDLFKTFGLEDRVVEVSTDDIESFESTSLYDVVLAEGFLCQVPNRDVMLEKICNLLAPGGIGVISYNDRYGFLLEMTRRMLLWRACQIKGIDDLHSEASLDMATDLYSQDFGELNGSRSMEAWWKDNLVNPFITAEHFWSHPELLTIVESAGCNFFSSSPQWDLSAHFAWYKNVSDPDRWRGNHLSEWSRAFTYLCTGLRPVGVGQEEAPQEVITAVGDLVSSVSKYTQDFSISIGKLEYPPVLSRFFSSLDDPRIATLNEELERVYKVASSGDLDALLSSYHDSIQLRNLWGACYHYFCFNKPLGTPTR
jgi:SAM-dependent methyltransferase